MLSIPHFLILVCSVLLFGCAGSEKDFHKLEARLQTIESKQDALITLLEGMQDKNDFMATRMGWQPPPDTSAQIIPIGNSPVDGAANPVLTIVEFTDLQCPYCAQIAPILDSLTKTYPQKIRVVFKNFPLSFHPQAPGAAAAALVAGKQGRFFEFRYLVAPHFRTLGDSLYLALAGQMGLDMQKFKSDMVLTPEISEIIEADMELGRKLGVQGTPTLFVNGRLAQDRSFNYFVGLMRKAEGQ